MKLITITAKDLPDAWFQCVDAIVNQGREFKIDKGSYANQTRLEIDYVTIHIEKPYLRDIEGFPLIPIMPEGVTIPPPTTREYVVNYASYIMTADKKPGEQYTYGERLWRTGQIDRVVEIYKKYGFRNNQMILQIGRTKDSYLNDPPCLRHVDTKIQDGRLHFFIYFRSWDLWGGMPSNLAGLSILQEYMADEIGVEPGEFVCSSKGLHLYDYAVPFAKMRCMK